MSHQNSCHSDQCHSCCEHEHEEHGHHHHHHHEGEFAEELLEMADVAWMEVLKEKIKQQIIASSGEHLDNLAKLVSDANKERWKHKLSSHKVCQDYRQKLGEFFSHGKE